jgi:D-inositol-3-phosphate glycosyltransferase
MLSVHTCPLATLGGKKTGGMNVYVRELSAELGRRGVRVDIFTRSQDSRVPRINDTALGDCARVIHIPVGPETPLSTSDIYPFIPEFVHNVVGFARAEGLSYDLIHSHYWLSGLAAHDLSRLWQAPTIQMFHTLGHMKNRVAQGDDQLEPPLRIESERRIMREADYIVAATPAERVQLMWLYGTDMKKIRIIPPGVDTNRFKPIPRAEARHRLGLPEDDQMLLFVGRIEPLKGIDTLLRALAILSRDPAEPVNRLFLSVVGGTIDDPQQEDIEVVRLRNLRQDLGLGDLVTFLGAKNQETLQYYYAAAEAVIMPSYYESFGMVALEAMACGIPVVASEVGGLAYLIQDGITGFHVPANDPEELAGRIGLILNNRTLRGEMSSAAASYAQRFSWVRIADQIERLYDECLGNIPPSRLSQWP